MKKQTPNGTTLVKETVAGALSNEPAAGGSCTVALAAGTNPPLMCSAESDLRKVIRHNITGTVPVLYGLNPSASGLGCTGRTWEAGVAGGWACAVAVARDGVGNLGISKPLRVCYEVLGGECNNPGPPPTCTDGCVMPTTSTSVGMPVILGPR